MPNPKCQFTIVPASIPAIPKEGERAQFTVKPPNKICLASCTSYGDIQVTQCEGGIVSVKATADNARGTVFITKTCKVGAPEEGIKACGPTTIAIAIGAMSPQDYGRVFSILLIAIVFGIGGYTVGEFLGGLLGLTLGTFIGTLLGSLLCIFLDRKFWKS